MSKWTIEKVSGYLVIENYYYREGNSWNKSHINKLFTFVKWTSEKISKLASKQMNKWASGQVIKWASEQMCK